jgi:hypothetical protein
MSYGKFQLLRNTRRSTGRNAGFDVIYIPLAAKEPGEFHIGEKLTA